MAIPQTEIIIRKDGVELARRVVAPGEYVIGRGEDADFQIKTPAASRHHARLTVKADEWLVEDLASANGTFINDSRIEPGGPARVFPSQALRVGDVAVALRRVVGDEAVTVSPGAAAVRALLPEELRARRYSVGAEVGRGGMGAVMGAQDQTIRREVAMKVLLPENGDITRLVEEAQITGQLEHPNIVPVYELGVDAQGRVFYTMKMVRGISLGKVLALLAEESSSGVPPGKPGNTDETPVPLSKKYPLGALLIIFQKVGDALAFAHAKGVIHRDLKPENIMLGEFGEALVMDWGLAKLVGQKSAAESPALVRSARQEDDASKTQTGTIMGTPQYMAPEQARGQIDQLDARADVYALGAILYHMLTLTPPATGTDMNKLLAEVRMGRIVHPRERVRKKKLPHLPDGHMPDSLAAVAMKAMALRPAGRYASVPELQAEVAAFQSGFATKAERASFARLFVLLVRRNKIASIAAVIILALVAGFTWKVAQEGSRATAALARLRGTAPTFAAQAATLIEGGKFDDALDKIAIAIELDDANPAYHHFRANTLQATARIREAIESYRRALALKADPAAQTNLVLCESLLAENGGDPDLPLPLKSKLLDALLAQKRQADAVPLSRELKRK